MRLNGWRRLGIVFAVLALVSTFVFVGRTNQKSLSDNWDFWMNVCIKARHQPPVDCAEVADAHNKGYEAQLQQDTVWGMELAAAAIGLLWGCAEIAVKTAKWVRRGFQRAQ
jgi:hypothetical protein